MGKVNVWLSCVSWNPRTEADDVLPEAIGEMFRDLAGISFRRIKRKPKEISAGLLMKAEARPEQYMGILSAFYELIKDQGQDRHWNLGWTLIITSRGINGRKTGLGPDEEPPPTIVPYFFTQFPNTVLMDCEVEAEYLKHKMWLVSWTRRDPRFMYNYDMVCYELRQWTSERAPTAKTAQYNVSAERAQVDGWIRTMDPAYDPSARDRTGPRSLGGTRFLLSQALHRNGFQRGGDLSRHCSSIPKPEEVGLIKCTEASDLPVEMERSEVSAENVMSQGTDVDLDVTNNGTQPITVRVPRGLAFEVDTPNLGVQCVVAETNQEFVLQPGERRHINVPGYCANEHFSGPGVMPMMVTPYKTSSELTTQDMVWDHFATAGA